MHLDPELPPPSDAPPGALPVGVGAQGDVGVEGDVGFEVKQWAAERAAAFGMVPESLQW